MSWLSFRRWLWRVIVETDVWVNVFCGGTNGMTISAHAYTAKRNKHRWGIWLSSALNRIDPDHCFNAVQNDLMRARAVQDELMG